ncbi:MAG TPA: hypothetical protein PKM21_07175 [Anaerolineales bacterium]|nr:hypothetical protein [Anaerolineales bacterium]
MKADLERPSSRRRQHYYFAHKALPGLLFSNPGRFFQTLAQDGSSFLEYAWQQSADPQRGSGVPQTRSSLPSDGLALHLEQLEDGTHLALITLPPPQAMTEVYFAAAVYRPAPKPRQAALLRYIILEYGLNSFNEDLGTVLGEWDSSAAIHHNLGRGPAPELPAFRTTVLNLIYNNDKETTS